MNLAHNSFLYYRLYEQLLESLTRQKTMLEQTAQLITSVDGGKAKLIGKPEYFEYLLPSWLHPITVCYPKNKNEDDLLEYRKVCILKFLITNTFKEVKYIFNLKFYKTNCVIT